MNSPEAVATPARSTVHPIVRLDHIVRMSCFLLLIVVFYSVFHAAGRADAVVIVLLLLWGLVWPQLAYLHARLSRDSKRAEHLNMFIDSVMVGAWAAGMHFSLWPSIMFITGIHLGNLGVGGVRLGDRQDGQRLPVIVLTSKDRSGCSTPTRSRT